ncbi:hypothetical protein ACJRO7_016632 [Eucalyptus globulus]|uniref:Uncharacterized protein n=1 Tax=Eucalyptus globulus TaxID=34317 RepID=A0ABD3LB94_EUCGL
MSQEHDPRSPLGPVKDRTGIGLAKVARNVAPELRVAIVEATSHGDDPAKNNYIRRILILSPYSVGDVHACLSAPSQPTEQDTWICCGSQIPSGHPFSIEQRRPTFTRGDNVHD